MYFVDKIWRVIEPIAVYLGINLLMQAVLSWYFFGKNIKDSEGAISMGTELMDANTIPIMFFTMLLCIPIMVVYMKKDEDRKGFLTFSEHYRLVDFKGFIYFLPLGICMCLGITKLVTLFPIDNILGSYEKVIDSYNQSNIVLRIITLCILVPIAEELVYRGLLYKRLKEYNERTIAAYIAAIVFGVVHMNLVQGLYAFFCAVILIYVYELYKTILAPILLHMIVNTMALISGEITLFTKINNLLLAKIFFMLIELTIVVLLVRIIWKKKKDMV